MNTLIVANQVSDWPLCPHYATVVSAHTYLTDPQYRFPARVINLCFPLTYQSPGYYVSLLAQARNHCPLPEVMTIEDVQSSMLRNLLTDRLDAIIQSALAGVDDSKYALAIYFGQDPAARMPDLAREIFDLVPAPLLHLEFARDLHDLHHWQLTAVAPLSLTDIHQPHWQLLQHACQEYCSQPLLPAGHGFQPAHHREHPAVAILYDPSCEEPPSNEGAIGKFRQAALALDMDAEVITLNDAHRLGDFDALFIRDTTSIKHYTYQLSRQAMASGLVVMDDPDSIIQCTNKVFLNELFHMHHLPVPKTLIVHRDNIDQIIPELGLPCIVKQPDGAFSLGVVKVHSKQQLVTVAEQLLQKSALILAQQYLPTPFDWRIGILDRQPLFACKYFMAPGHWQIIKRQHHMKLSEGQAAAVPLSEVPPFVMQTALASANLIGNGFYGVDLKQIGQQCFIVEINDNPNVDMGNEDGVLQDALYQQVMRVFRNRVANAGESSIR